MELAPVVVLGALIAGLLAGGSEDPGPLVVRRGRLGARRHVVHGGQVLDGQAERLEERDLLRPGASGTPPHEQLAQLPLNVLGAEAALAHRHEHVARLDLVLLAAGADNREHG